MLAASCALALVAACNRAKGQTSHKPTDAVDLDTRAPSPESHAQAFEVDDDVSVLDEDGSFETDARITKIEGKLVFAEATHAKGLPGKEWMPLADGKDLRGDEPTAAKGYEIRIGSGRSTSMRWFPSTRVFPPPWADSSHIKLGDVLFERRSGDFEPRKCVVTEVPEDVRASVRARCDKDTQAKAIERQELFRSFAPASVAQLALGDIVYDEKMVWAMVVGKSDGKIIIRRVGTRTKDALVDASRLETVH